jgi:hypothetical protein
LQGNVASDHEHLVPATHKLLQLNNRWQRKIKDDKDRIRNVCIGEQPQDDIVENNDNVENELAKVIEDNLPSNLDNNKTISSSGHIMSVTKVIVPNEITRENMARQFTLNKNQKAAFMIITGHLDGLDNLNGGTMM